jgi:hypothetical protein
MKEFGDFLGPELGARLVAAQRPLATCFAGHTNGASVQAVTGRLPARVTSPPANLLFNPPRNRTPMPSFRLHPGIRAVCFLGRSGRLV